jgi:hypothetical protein
MRRNLLQTATVEQLLSRHRRPLGKRPLSCIFSYLITFNSPLLNFNITQWMNCVPNVAAYTIEPVTST